MAYRLAQHPPAPASHQTPQHRRRRRRRRRQRVTRRTVAVLPTLFTLSNLLCGAAAIFVASWPETVRLPFDWSVLTFASVLVFLGMLMDGLDGRIARLTRSYSDLGEQLDSMADMVSFGVAPAFLAVRLIGVETPFFTNVAVGDGLFDRVGVLIAGIYVCCAALRLARFNIELSQGHTTSKGFFKGLPTPGAAGTVVSLVLLHEHFLANFPAEHWSVSVAAGGMVAVMLLVAIAMVSSFAYVHVMNRYVRGRAAFGTLAKAVVVGLLLAVHLQASLAAAFVLYAVSAPVASLHRRVRRRAQRARAAG